MAHILVVDDEPRIREFVRHHLEKEEHTVSEAANGLEAWRQMRYARFDLLVTDLMMPEIHGEDLICLLEKDTTTASMPILLMGNRAADLETDENRSVPVKRGTGAILLIKKPFHPRQMLEMVRVLLASPVDNMKREVRTIPASS